MRTWKRGALAAAVAGLLIPLGGAKGCTAEGPGGTPLPVHLKVTWYEIEGPGVVFTDHIIRPRPGVTLRGKTFGGQYVWGGKPGPISDSGP